MAEPLKNQFGEDIPKRIAAQISVVYPKFPAQGFVRDALDGYDALELMPRGRKIADSLFRFLPSGFEQAIDVLLRSLDAPLPAAMTRSGNETGAMASFYYLPHTQFVANYGLDHFDASMHAQYQLTQRFTAEFSIRPFLERHPDKTLAQLRIWCGDPNEHVRRLVSEGTRPRLPWAPRLRQFQKDPRPIIDLLEQLKDDPSLYVRRSVANNLNDIGKDHPDLLVRIAERWGKNAPEERRWIIRHALRSSIKCADPRALRLLGVKPSTSASIKNISIHPRRAAIGGDIRIEFDLISTSKRFDKMLVDLRVHFVKASGKTSPKVFKLKTFTLKPGETIRLSKTITLQELTTRKHYPGTHPLEAIVNGVIQPLGEFELIYARKNARKKKPLNPR